MSTIYRKPDQVIQPYNFGDPYQKSTCLWLKGLPKLMPLYYDAPLFNNKVNKGEFVVSKSGKTMAKWFADAWKLPPKERAELRSKTFPGIALAMSTQWGII